MLDLCENKICAKFIHDYNYLMQKGLKIRSHNFIFNMLIL